MLDNLNDQGNLADQPIMAGTPVYDVHGDKIGEVMDRGLQRDALIVHKGILFPKELYIPVSAIRGRDAEGVYLSIAQDDIGSRNWDTPPTDAGAMRSSPGAVDASGPVSGYDTGDREQPPRGNPDLLP